MKKFISIITLSLVSASALAGYQYRDPAVYQDLVFKNDDMVHENAYADAYDLSKNNRIDKLIKRYTDNINGCAFDFMALNAAAEAAYDTKNSKNLKRIEAEMDRIYNSCKDLTRSAAPQQVQQTVQPPVMIPMTNSKGQVIGHQPLPLPAQSTSQPIQPVQQPTASNAGKPFINPSLPNTKVYGSKVYQASPYDLLNLIKEDNTLTCDVKFRVLNALSSEYSEADRAPITYSLTELADKCDALQTKSSSTTQPVSTFVWQTHKVNTKQAIDLIYETITIDLQDGAKLDKDYFKSLFTNELPCSVKPTIVDAVKKLATKLQNEGGPMFLNHVTDAANEIGCK